MLWLLAMQIIKARDVASRANAATAAADADFGPAWLDLARQESQCGSSPASRRRRWRRSRSRISEQHPHGGTVERLAPFVVALLAAR